MLLDTRLITSGDTRRYEIDYAEFLQHGDTISSVTVTTTGPTSSMGAVTLDVSKTKVFFFLQGGTTGETPIVKTKIITVFGETVNDTIDYRVVAP